MKGLGNIYQYQESRYFPGRNRRGLVNAKTPSNRRHKNTDQPMRHVPVETDVAQVDLVTSQLLLYLKPMSMGMQHTQKNNPALLRPTLDPANTT